MRRGWEKASANDDESEEQDDKWLSALRGAHPDGADCGCGDETAGGGNHRSANGTAVGLSPRGHLRAEDLTSKSSGCQCGMGVVACSACSVSLVLALLLTWVLSVAVGGDSETLKAGGSRQLILPPAQPASFLQPPQPALPPMESSQAGCSDLAPIPTFCAAKSERGLCEHKSVRRQCAFTCGACSEFIPPLNPPPHLPPRPRPLLPPPPLPHLPPLSVPPLPPPRQPFPAPPVPGGPRPSAECARLSNMRSIAKQYCFDDPARRAHRDECERAYLETDRGLVPCAFEGGKCSMARTEPVICPSLLHPPPSLPPPPPPLPSPFPNPPPRQPSPPVLSDLNARFRNAKPSNDLAEAGILIHMFDQTESKVHRWRGCPNHKGDSSVEGNDCQLFGDRFSASMVVKDKAVLFGGGGGIIFRPGFNKIRCSYGGDGGTRNGDGCADGSFCPSSRSALDGWCDGAPHRPRDLQNMLRWWGQHATTYNEVIVDASYMDAHLPQSIEAIISDAAVHKQFVDFYGVSPRDYPLVGFRPENVLEPFFLLGE